MKDLINRRVDPWLLGGISLFLLILDRIPGFDLSARVGPWLVGLLVLFSFPHFIASYFIFYGRKGAFQRQYPHIAYTAPASLFVILFLSVTLIPAGLGWVARVAYLLLFWHFAKQAYGCSIWLGIKGEKKIGESDRQLLLAACLLVGVAGFFSGQEPGRSISAFGVSVPLFFLPTGVTTATLVLSRIALAVTVIRLTWIRFSPEGFLPLIALFSWFDPWFSNSSMVLLVPILHGIQSLPFPTRVALNESKDGVLVFMAGAILAVALGYGLLFWLPRSLLTAPAAGAMTLFLNVHHYFIDSVLWKFGNPKVRERLTGGQLSPV